jgi:glycyl-tRNA synthetase
VEKGKKPQDAREFYLYLATEQLGATGFITPCPHCGGELTAPRPFNLMLQTHYGPIASDENLAYLRPETAQAIFVQFKNVLDSSRVKVPFGIGQIGKAFRNEITPRNYTFRSREFEQMELEFFIPPDEAIRLMHGSVAQWSEGADLSEPQPNWGWAMWHRYWVAQRTEFYRRIGLGPDVLDYHWQKPEELAHYARACVDILFKFPFGTEELEGIAARGDFDLAQHQKLSGKPLEVFDEELRAAATKLTDEQRKVFVAEVQEDWNDHNKSREEAAAFCEKLLRGVYLPHVIEPSAGLDRMTLAILCAAYREEEKTDVNGKVEQRTVLRFHPRTAPTKAGVFPLLKNKPELVAKAREVYELLKNHCQCFYDESGAIGRRYARQDEIGTPFCVTIDFDTLGEKPELLNTVTIRHRDDGKQERLAIGELLSWLLEKIR